MSYTQQIAFEELRTFDSAELTGGYDPIGDPLANPSFILKIVNSSTVDVTISVDGLKDCDIVPSNGFVLYDMSKYGIPSVQFVPQGTQFFVNGSAGIGNIYLVSLYNVVR